LFDAVKEGVTGWHQKKAQSTVQNDSLAKIFLPCANAAIAFRPKAAIFYFAFEPCSNFGR